MLGEVPIERLFRQVRHNKPGVQVTLNEVLQGILPILFLFPQKSGIHDWAGHYIIASLFVMCCWKVLP